MSTDAGPSDSDDNIQSLPERPATSEEAEHVKGGSITLPSGPVVIPHPIIKPSGAPRSLEPCL